MAEEAKTEEREFFAVFDGTKGRPSNTMYLDMAERIEAEKVRARLEEREPRLDDLGALQPSVGTQLVVKELQVDNSLFSNPAVGSGAVEAKEVDALVKADVEVEPPAPEVDLSYAAQVARERQSENDALLGVETGNNTETSTSSGEDVRTSEDVTY